MENNVKSYADFISKQASGTEDEKYARERQHIKDTDENKIQAYANFISKQNDEPVEIEIISK